MDTKGREKMTAVLLTALFVAITLAYMAFCVWVIFIASGTPLLVKAFMVLGLIVLALVLKSLIANVKIRKREIDEAQDLSGY